MKELKHQIIAFYLDYVNNWLTVASYAKHVGLSEYETELILETGKQLNES